MDMMIDSPTPENMQGTLSFNDRLKNKLEKSSFWARCLQQAVTMGQKDMV